MDVGAKIESSGGVLEHVPFTFPSGTGAKSTIKSTNPIVATLNGTEEGVMTVDSATGDITVTVGGVAWGPTS